MQTEPPKADPRKRKRRWFQFSLRSLLVLTTFVAIGTALVKGLTADRHANVDLDFRTGPWPETDLSVAIIKGDDPLVRKILSSNPSAARMADRDGMTPLHWAAKADKPTAVDLLLRAKAIVDAPTTYRTTALMLAYDPVVAQRLLAAGADPTILGMRGWSAYRLAASRGDSMVLSCFRNAGFRPDLLAAIELNDLARTKELIAANPSVARKAIGSDSTPLHVATQQGNLSIARILIDAGADCNARDSRRSTPLHNAALWGGRELIVLLKEHGADLAATDCNGDTPLHNASSLGNVEAVRTLLSMGASRRVKNIEGESPMESALRLQENGIDRAPVLEEFRLFDGGKN
jgi:uncharacterized protein